MALLPELLAYKNGMTFGVDSFRQKQAKWLLEIAWGRTSHTRPLLLSIAFLQVSYSYSKTLRRSGGVTLLEGGNRQE